MSCGKRKSAESPAKDDPAIWHVIPVSPDPTLNRSLVFSFAIRSKDYSNDKCKGDKTVPFSSEDLSKSMFGGKLRKASGPNQLTAAAVKIIGEVIPDGLL